MHLKSLSGDMVGGEEIRCKPAAANPEPLAPSTFRNCAALCAMSCMALCMMGRSLQELGAAFGPIEQHLAPWSPAQPLAIAAPAATSVFAPPLPPAAAAAVKGLLEAWSAQSCPPLETAPCPTSAAIDITFTGSPATFGICLFCCSV
jgi:hypothetical protein